MMTREAQIDPAEVMRVAAEASAAFDSVLTPEELAALEHVRVETDDAGVAYSMLEREQAMEAFAGIAAIDSLQILAERIRTTIERREQELYHQCLEAYYAADELSRDPAHADVIPHVETMRRAHLAQYGREIPARGEDETRSDEACP
jgi:hypothetical protein